MGTRELLTEAAKKIGLETEIKLVEPHRYLAILERIIASRTSLNSAAVSALWWWEALREPVAYTQPSDALCTLKALIDPNESIWFVVEAGSQKERGNFWLYDSKIGPVCAVLQELPLVEYYIVQKKLQWLVCENHHGLVIASGEPMATKLERLRA